MRKDLRANRVYTGVMTMLCGLVLNVCAFAQGTETILHAFKGGTDGDHPSAGLVFDPSGNLFGVTTKGGNQNCGDYLNGCGTLFELTPNGTGGWTEKQVLVVPGGVAGGDPVDITSDPVGNLFVTEFNHGVNGVGQIVELSPDGHGGWVKSLVHAFNGPDGYYPNGVILDSTGNLYGMTQSNTNTGDGLVFKLSKNASGHWIDQTLYTFSSLGDEIPDNVTMALDAAGNLYGTLYDGGNSMACNFYPACGVVFQLSPTSGGGVKETVLHNFTNFPADGYFPWGNLIVDATGNVYGTAELGGEFNQGAVFELSPQAGGQWQETIIYSFTGGADGGEPNGLTFDASGNIYGSSYNGVFELSPNGSGGWSETTLYTTNGNTKDGNGFMGAPVLDSSGNIYGIAEYGGLNDCKHPGGGCGLVYEIKR